MISAASSSNAAYLRLGLRALQFFSCLLAMSLAAAGYPGGGGTRSSIFVLLMGYTGMLYTLWYVVAVDILHYANRLALRVEMIIDAVLVVMLLIAGICLAASDTLEHLCDGDWHCHNLKAAVAFDFIAMALFVGTLFLTFFVRGEPLQGHRDVQLEDPVPYRQEATPTSDLGGRVSVKLFGIANLALRGLQFLCCLLGMCFTASGGVNFHASNFVLLMNYTGMLYTLWYIAAVEIFIYASRLSIRAEQCLDVMLSLMLLIGGICLASSNYVVHCNSVWHCHNLEAATAFTWLAMFGFLGSLSLSFLTTKESISCPTEVPSQYYLDFTRFGVLSPIESVKSDSSS
ncbi:hypothetical protein BBO99_00002673 [Phytophthora kernoviae]|uniref:MARVEL domain-containing protein n=2 Tax=Phytophthora kernoviae TaxID=325452 RepID=A0A3R7KWN8_9STRA|nr:hypothetical protein G195_003820 [Phytophthora kernoviae 00238/432]KAG2527947.1 hypothetical protein JM16_002398 [Phytophthora kernoviae]KAG2529364.1 hypothetical protein JM18_002805 [Phytophthora kernoviae]RLN36652.1 hypothetical protein BBI17_002688 [Phytophthora kernoviae]RLN82737.1 hypothetical protein BBO99_00002673 [Phytophthora kernoviae]